MTSSDVKRSKHIRLIVLLVLLTWFVGCLLETGDLGSMDAGVRLQVAHSLWTSDPVVSADFDQSFPIGRDGRPQAPWGIGQSLIMLPADIAASSVVSSLPETLANKLRPALVGYLTFPLVSAAAVAFGVLVLRRLGFSEGQSIAGGIALFFCTSLFPYTQIHQENSCALLLILISFYGVLSWLKTGTGPYLMMTGAALGLSILMRLTAVLDLGAVVAFAVILALVEARDAKHSYRSIIADFGKYVLPFLVVAFAIDRIYQFDRFGTWTDTYLDRRELQQLILHPGTPANWPWINPFWDGVYLLLLSPKRSIFLFDPLLLVTFWMMLRYWRYIYLPVRTFVIIAVLLLGAYVSFYAKFYPPGGAFSWGSRFTTTPVILISMVAVPLLLAMWTRLSPFEKALAIVVIVLATIVQLLSVTFWYMLEEAQMSDTGSEFFIGMRFVNLLATTLDKVQDWHLATPSVNSRYLQPNFLPYLMDKYVSTAVAHTLQLMWSAAVVLAMAAAVRLTLLCLRCEPLALLSVIGMFLFIPGHMAPLTAPRYDDTSIYAEYLSSNNVWGVRLFAPNYSQIPKNCESPAEKIRNASFSELRTGVNADRPFILVQNGRVGLVEYNINSEVLRPSACQVKLVLRTG
jgi:hypothetical protein